MVAMSFDRRPNNNRPTQISQPQKASLNMTRVYAIVFGIVAVLSMVIVGSTYYTVDQTQRAVLVRNGAIVGTEQPGLHFKTPFIESVAKIDVTNKIHRWEKLEGYSHDQQASHYQISVNYQIKADQVAQVYRDFGGEDNVVARILTPSVLKHSKVVIGKFTAQTSIQDRGRLNNEIYAALVESIKDTPILITGLNVEDIKFGPEYEASINQRMIAEVGVQTLNQNLEKERVTAQITVTKAQAAADSTLAQATAEARATKLRGEAEAYAITAKSAALGQNPNLVLLTQAERWNGTLPTTMIPGSAIPMLNMGSK